MELDPNKNPHPTMSPEKARSLGHDVSRIRTCGVYDEGRFVGCANAPACAKNGFGTRKLFGFGPRSELPGTEGQGPKNVGYYHKDAASGQEHMNQVPCYVAIGSLLDAYLVQDKTGDEIRFLGTEGTEILTQKLLPVMSKDGKTGRLELFTEKQVVAEWTGSERATALSDYAREMDAINRRAERQRLLEEEFADEAQEAEVPKTVTEEEPEPVRRGRRGKTALPG